MRCEPLTHLLVGPGPIKGMGIAMVVFRPGSYHMGLELLLILPGRTLQVIMRERMDEDFRLVQPGGVGRRVPRSPPATTVGEVPPGITRNVARPAILDQEDPS